MSLTVVTSGTLGPLTVGTETNIVAAQTPSTPATYVVSVDCAALAAGEVAFLRIYTIELASGTERLVVCSSFIRGTDLDLIVDSIPLPVDISWRPTIQQKNGTGRSFPYKVFTL